MGKTAYFKQHQHSDIYHYFKVVGGPGKTQEVVNFLNKEVVIYVEHNYIDDPSGLTGTWCT